MKKKLLFLFVLLIVTMVGWTQVISTITDTTVCAGSTTIDIPVKVSSFNAVGSISLKLSYVNSAITSPTVVYKAPGLDTWGTFTSNMTTAGTIIISAYDPDVTPPNPGLTLSSNTILFSIRFTIVNLSTPSVISFTENSQGNACEYAGVGPDYIPFTDTPLGSYYFEGEALLVPGPIAPGITKNPTDASVCADVTLTVTTSSGSGGTGTIADEYRYSTNNGANWSAWSLAVPSFAAVPGTNLIQSRRTATGAGCNESSWNQVSWTVNAKQKISGTFNYYNFSGDILLTGADITVKLYRSGDLTHSTLLATDVTDASGYYEFTGTCPDCDYDIVATSTHNAEGAINTTDAAQANFWGPNAYPIQKVRFHAGDVSGPDLFVGGSDASRIQLKFVNNLAFDRDPWTFWKTGLVILHNPLEEEPEYTESYPKVNLPVGSDVDADMYGLVTGDFNRSFNPNITKTASSSLTLLNEGTRLAGTGEVIDLPLRLVDAALIGAASLVLEYPVEMLVIKDVLIPGAGGNLDWSATGGELRIGWHSNVPLNLSRSSDFITVRLETTTAFTIGNSIKFKLADDPLNELADEMYNVISPAVILVEVVEATALGLGDLLIPMVLTINCEPNPFRQFTTFSYALPVEGKVSLVINNILGTRVATLVQETQVPGNRRLTFDGSVLPNGIYLATLRLKTEENEMVRTIKLVINK